MMCANECWDLPTQHQVFQADEELKFFWSCMFVNFVPFRDGPMMGGGDRWSVWHSDM